MRIVNFTALSEVWQFSQRSSQHCFVARAIVRRAERTTHWMIDENSARRRDFLHDVEGRTDHEGRDAVAFDDMSDETDGLMAERSVRH